MFLEKKRFFIILNKSGSALLITLAISVVVGLSIGYLQERVLAQKKSTMSNANNIENDILLNSILDFMKVGIRQRWCFNDTLLPDSNCDLKHSRNVERLLLSQKTFDTLKQLGVELGSTSLNRISFRVSLGSLASNHPLRRVVENHAARGNASVEVTIQKNENNDLASVSSESILKVDAELMVSSAFSTNSNTKMSSLVTVYPFELSNYALIIPNNLYIGQGYRTTAAMGKGDVLIPNVGSFANRGKGLIFESPIYVNRNIYLNSISQEQYAPVTFASDVVMGSGRLMRNNTTPFTPMNLGGPGSKYYSDINSFGGFKNGLTVLGEIDPGLDVLSGIVEGNNVTDLKKTMEICIDRSKAITDLEKTKKSDITARWSSQLPAEGKYNLLIGLTRLNRFTEQSVDEGIRSADGDYYVSPSYSQINRNSRPIGRVKVEFEDGKEVRAFVSRNSEIIIKPKFINRQWIEDQINQLNGFISSINQKLSVINADLSSAQKELSDELAKPSASQDSNKINNLKNKIKNLENDKQDEEQRLVNRTSQLTNMQTQLTRANDAEANPPTLKISINDVVKAGAVEFNQINFSFEIVNQQYFDKKFSIYVNAFDVGTKNGNDIRDYFGMDKTGDYDYGTRNGRINFNVNGTQVSPDSFGVNWQNMRPDKYWKPVEEPIDESLNYGELDRLCQDPDSGLAFSPAADDVSFTNNTRHSWNFANPNPNRITFNVDTSTFYVHSIVGECVFGPELTFISGFFVCDKLIIEPRSKRLQIVGTIIAGKAAFHPSALTSGIVWSNIYHPNAVIALRQKRVLKPNYGTGCELSSPIWHTNPSLFDLADHYKCNSISLRANANPFTWTTVDPDCGLASATATTTTCKNRPKRFFIKELGRGVE